MTAENESVMSELKEESAVSEQDAAVLDGDSEIDVPVAEDDGEEAEEQDDEQDEDEEDEEDESDLADEDEEDEEEDD